MTASTRRVSALEGALTLGLEGAITLGTAALIATSMAGCPRTNGARVGRAERVADGAGYVLDVAGSAESVAVLLQLGRADTTSLLLVRPGEEVARVELPAWCVRVVRAGAEHWAAGCGGPLYVVGPSGTVTPVASDLGAVSDAVWAGDVGLVRTDSPGEGASYFVMREGDPRLGANMRIGGTGSSPCAGTLHRAEDGSVLLVCAAQGALRGQRFAPSGQLLDVRPVGLGFTGEVPEAVESCGAACWELFTPSYVIEVRGVGAGVIFARTPGDGPRLAVRYDEQPRVFGTALDREVAIPVHGVEGAVPELQLRWLSPAQAVLAYSGLDATEGGSQGVFLRTIDVVR